jgi:hypothetical protein
MYTNGNEVHEIALDDEGILWAVGLGGVVQRSNLEKAWRRLTGLQGSSPADT